MVSERIAGFLYRLPKPLHDRTGLIGFGLAGGREGVPLK